jgi:hypothetical protein
MQPHPLFDSKLSFRIGAGFILLIIALLGALLILYGDLQPLNAFTDAFIYIGLLALCDVLSWYFAPFIRVWQAQIVFALLVQLICLGVGFMLLSMLEMEDINTFERTLPLRILTGAGCWIILLQWYRIQQMNNEKNGPLKEEKTAEKDSAPPSAAAEWIDRISVKDGGRIHILPLKDLLYIQASGDYVTLFTHSGQYIKEQTMKYFDTHLPSFFVRIHRSTIVNAEHILRVELFGKESYNVRLKNGANLRASVTGYKLLKERLDL